jgi:hypothetical protein
LGDDIAYSDNNIIDTSAAGNTEMFVQEQQLERDLSRPLALPSRQCIVVLLCDKIDMQIKSLLVDC